MKIASISRRCVVIGGLAAAASVGACRAAPRQRLAKAGSTRPDLYNCEGCDGVYEGSSANLPAKIGIAPGEDGVPLIVTGQVLQADAVTPAPGVVLYVYQTNAAGLYANGSPETEWSRRHGRIRGWLKTDAKGRYTIRTIKPAPYPNERFPAHIHFTVLETGRPPYYIDDVVFDGEFGVTADYRARQELRGGSGIARLKRTADGALLAGRDIILERHP